MDICQKKYKRFIRSLRLNYLPVTITPVFLGGALAYNEKSDVFVSPFFLLLLLGVGIYHFPQNMINDYYDYKSGTDRIIRCKYSYLGGQLSGGSGALDDGMLEPIVLMYGAMAFLIISAIILLPLAWVGGGRPLFFLVLAAFPFAYIYSGKPFQLVYRGIGEITVAFGAGIPVLFTAYFLQVQVFSWEPILIGITMGLTTANFLMTNSFLDYEADKKSGKNTLLVMVGREKGVFLHLIFGSLSYFTLLAWVGMGHAPILCLIYLSTLPWFTLNWIQLRKMRDENFRKEIEIRYIAKRTISLYYLCVVLLSIGYLAPL